MAAEPAVSCFKVTITQQISHEEVPFKIKPRLIRLPGMACQATWAETHMAKQPGPQSWWAYGGKYFCSWVTFLIGCYKKNMAKNNTPQSNPNGAAEWCDVSKSWVKQKLHSQHNSRPKHVTLNSSIKKHVCASPRLNLFCWAPETNLWERTCFIYGHRDWLYIEHLEQEGKNN